MNNINMTKDRTGTYNVKKAKINEMVPDVTIFFLYICIVEHPYIMNYISKWNTIYIRLPKLIYRDCILANKSPTFDIYSVVKFCCFLQPTS